MAEKLFEEGKPGIHHAKPTVMTIKSLAFPADDFAKPLLDGGRFDIVVIGPAFVAGVIGRIDIDALDLPSVERQESLESKKVVALDDEIAGARVTARQGWYIFE